MKGLSDAKSKLKKWSYSPDSFAPTTSRPPTIAPTHSHPSGDFRVKLSWRQLRAAWYWAGRLQNPELDENLGRPFRPKKSQAKSLHWGSARSFVTSLCTLFYRHHLNKMHKMNSDITLDNTCNLISDKTKVIVLTWWFLDGAKERTRLCGEVCYLEQVCWIEATILHESVGRRKKLRAAAATTTASVWAKIHL